MNFFLLVANKKERSGGFTLLIASLMASLVLSIGIAIYNISLKEVILSSAGRESQFAFYAADGGTECALYWDLKNGIKSAFATTTLSDISCNEQTFSDVGGATGRSVFTVNFPPEPYCAIVTVLKQATSTVIESRGYNTCETGDPRRVERALRVQF